MNLFISILILLCINPVLAHAEIHKLKDRQGNTVFTNKDETGQLTTQKAKQPSVMNPITKEMVAQWINHPSFKYILALFLSAVFVFYLQYKVGSLLLKMLFKLLFVGIFGAMIYSIFISHYASLLSPDQTAPASIPAAINELKKQIHTIEKSQKKRLESIQQLTRSNQDSSEHITEDGSTLFPDGHQE